MNLSTLVVSMKVCEHYPSIKSSSISTKSIAMLLVCNRFLLASPDMELNIAMSWSLRTGLGVEAMFVLVFIEGFDLIGLIFSCGMLRNC